MNKLLATMKAKSVLGPVGRMLSASKGRMSRNYPRALLVFNSTIVAEQQAIWHGDLNLSSAEDTVKLYELAKGIGADLQVLRESDSHFTEDGEYPEGKAVVYVTKYGSMKLGDKVAEHYTYGAGTLPRLKEELVPKPFDREQMLEGASEALPYGPFSIVMEVKLPPMEELIDINTNPSEAFPYKAFYEYVAIEEGIELVKMDVSKYAVSSSTALELNRNVLEYLEHRLGDDEYGIEKEFQMVNFAYSPLIVDWEGIEHGVVYKIEREE